MFCLRVSRCFRRKFHACPVFFGKQYRSSEDEHFRAVFDRLLLRPSNTKIAELVRNQGSSSNFELVLNTSKHLKLEELIDVVRSLDEAKLAGSLKARKFTTLWNVVDVAMERQMSPSIDTSHLIDILLAWNKLEVSRICRLSRKGVELLASRFHQLTHEELYLLLFAIVTARKWPPSLPLRPVEERLRDLVTRTDDGRILGLISAAYFKSKTVCEDLRVIDDLVNRTSELINAGVGVDDVSLCSVAKFAGFVANRRVWRTGPLSVLSLVQSCAKNLNELSLLACVHLLEASAQQKISPDEFFEGVRRRICRTRFEEGLRVKELERFLLAVDQVGPELNAEETSELVAKLEELPADQKKKYLHSFQACVRVFAIHGVFLDEEISFCLGDSCVKPLTGSDDYPDALRELWELDSLVQISHPGYSGPRLPPDMVDLAVSKYARRECVVDSRSKDTLFPGEKLLFEALSFIGKSSAAKATGIGHQDSFIFYPLPFLSIPCILLTRSPKGKLEPASAARSLGFVEAAVRSAEGFPIGPGDHSSAVPPWLTSPTCASLWKNGVVLVPVQPRYLVRNHPDRLTGRLRLFLRLMRMSGAEIALLPGEVMNRNEKLRALLSR